MLAVLVRLGAGNLVYQKASLTMINSDPLGIEAEHNTAT